MMPLHELISLTQTRVESYFTLCLKNLSTPAPTLQDAMSYSVFNGGKRIRPLLVYATGLNYGADLKNLDAAAAAVELIHCYSLIHDDLPAMDNADLRRGKPACHKVFGEGMAILAGDALQALAFQVITDEGNDLSFQQKVQIIKTIGDASGLYGMAGGQAIDIALNNDLSLHDVTQLYKLKTGALLSASVQLGAIVANKTDELELKLLKKYADNIGLAFQLQDDLLDAKSASATGKPQGIDITNNKKTYPMLCGVEKTEETIRCLMDEAINSILAIPGNSQVLYELAEYLINREA